MYYVICSTPRSGSTLLAEALIAMGAGKPEEYFSPLIMNGRIQAQEAQKDFMQPTPLAYFERIRQENTVNGIFAIKMDYNTHLAPYPEILNNLTRILPEAKYISITRRNILRQAVSSSRAYQTGAWTWQLSQKQSPCFSYFSILRRLITLAREIELWEKFYTAHGIKPLRLVYEDLEEDYENTMRKVADFLGINGTIPPPSLKKQADALTEEWVERFNAAFQGNGPITLIARFLAR